MNNRIIGFIGIIVVLAAMSMARDILNPVLMALFMAIILVRPLEFLDRKKVPQTLSIVIAILGIISVYFLLLLVVGSSLSRFIDNADNYAQKLEQNSAALMTFLSQRGISLDITDSAFNPSNIMDVSSDFAAGLGETISNELTFILLTVFLIAEIDIVKLKIEAIASNSGKSIEYIRKIAITVRRYLSIKTRTSLMTGVSVTIGLALIGVDYPILWGLVAFLFNYIPNIGSILAAIPALALAFIQLGLPGTLWTFVLYMAVNMIIGNVIEPRIMGKGVGLSTFVVFVGLIFWGYILGTIGMFLSVPLTIAIKIMLEQKDSTLPYAVLLGSEEDIGLIKKDNSKAIH